MNTPNVIIRKKTSWKDYAVLGFDLEALKAGQHSWWANFVKRFDEVYVEMYDDCFEVMLTSKDGTTTALKQLSYNHLDIRMTKNRDLLALITHPNYGRIYFPIETGDIIRGSWKDVIRFRNGRRTRMGTYRQVLF